MKHQSTQQMTTGLSNLPPGEESKQDLSSGRATQPMCILEAEESKITSDPAFEEVMGYILFWYEKRNLESIVNHIKDKDKSQKKMAYLLYLETLE